MRKLSLAIAAAAALTAGSAVADAALAAPLPSAGSAPVFSALYTPGGAPLLQQTQYMWGGRRYCWYPEGWRGPGYYWCGYAGRRGLGWGGGYGWHGWGRDRYRPSGFPPYRFRDDGYRRDHDRDRDRGDYYRNR
jgi:hypothetical protein